MIKEAIDWTSVKLCGVSFLGFISGSYIVVILSGLAAVSTLVYNAIRVYKEFKEKKK